MRSSTPNRDDHIFMEHLEQVHYWHDRFEFSQDIDHLDNAERHAEVVRGYLPEHLQNLSIVGLSNLYLGSQSRSVDNSEV